MIGPLTLVKRRGGLLFLAIAPSLVLVGLFMNLTGSVGSSAGSPATSVVLSADPAWDDLPRVGGEDIPLPADDDVFTAMAQPGGAYRYTIAYASGDLYTVDMGPDGSYSYSFDPHESLGSRLVSSVVLALGLVLGGLGVMSLVWNLTGRDPRAGELADQLAVSSTGRYLIERWLRRSRWFRFAAASVGIVIGYYGPSEFWAMFVLGVAGTALGGALSELHLLRRKSESTAMAGLTVRRVSDYSEPRDTYALGGLAGASAVVAVLIATGVLAHGSVQLALCALVVVILTRWCQHRVVSRGRAAIRSELSSADDLLRYLAATQGFVRPAISLGFFLLSASLADDSASDLVQGVSVAFALIGVVWLFLGRQSRIPKMSERLLAA